MARGRYDSPLFHEPTIYICGKCGLRFETRFPPQDPLYGHLCGACDAAEREEDEFYMQALGEMGRRWDEHPDERRAP